jgi:2-polyprenyl-3-methyl-5-hydroxy-6-metoxy-1,4-benzoquinol methylase
MKNAMYTNKNSDYLQKNKSWHTEDSHWKAKQILKMINRNNLDLKYIAEIGCGAGEILNKLNILLNDKMIIYEGYDIAPDAIELTNSISNFGVKFFLEDLLEKKDIFFDLLLTIDVFEHVENYIDFLRKCREKAKYKIYHIPLEISISAILRNKLIESRTSVGHLHYFTKETALATLTLSGQEIIDYFYTFGSIDLPNNTLKNTVANIFRKLLYRINPDFCVRLLGGFSLIVLTK